MIQIGIVLLMGDVHIVNKLACFLISRMPCTFCSGFLPDSLFGIQMPWSSSMPDDGKDHKVTSGQASAMKAKLKKLMTTDPSLTETERDAVTEIGQEVH